jgi:ADP-heptose:LPS heptosyltransferase
MTGESMRIIVLRFSAMGDVALLAPVVKSFIASYPQHQLTIVSRPKFAAFFTGIQNVQYFPAEVDRTYSGLTGLIKLFNQLRKNKPNLVVDLHDNIRSRLICFLFKLIGKQVVRFDKGRVQKNQLTRKTNKVRSELPHTVERYKRAFMKAGFEFSIVDGPYMDSTEESESNVETWLKKMDLIKNELWIGLAPFAAHKTKIWPVENYFDLIADILKKSNSRFFLFGGGANEIDFFKRLIDQYPEQCIMVAGMLTLEEELALMKRLDKMICVDSSNMHLAALLGIPVISIWGGTHPHTGFGPFSKEKYKVVQISPDKLPCRPCSVYGKESCWRGDFACMSEISVDQISSVL